MKANFSRSIRVASRAEVQRAATLASDDSESVRYHCQTTELVRASKPLVWWELRQYLRELVNGNVGFLHMVRVH